MFEQKKIRLDTLGEYLADARSALNLSISEFSKNTKVREDCLRALEEGNFSALPADVYVHGFLKKIALLCRIDPEILYAQYIKEKKIQHHVKSTLSLQPNWKNKFIENLVITPKMIVVGLIGVLLLVTLVSVIWQIAQISKTPSLEIFKPADQQIVLGSFVELEGKASLGVSVFINGQNIFVDEKGNFKTQLGIASGPQELKIVAESRFGKKNSKTINIIGQSSQNQPKENFSLQVRSLGAIEISIILDDQPAAKIKLDKDQAQTFSAIRKISFSTSNAGLTHIFLNNKDLGIMGKPGEILENISFFPESDGVVK